MGMSVWGLQDSSINITVSKGGYGVFLLVCLEYGIKEECFIPQIAGGCGFRGSSFTAVNSYYLGGSPNISLSSPITTAEDIVGKFQFFFMWREDSTLEALKNFP
ncbi:hypothetical protein U1Q18_013526 [Sarracenia purpurea var. burkii]